MKIRFISPWSYDLDIGGEYNEMISRFDDNDFIVITDQDVLRFDGFASRVKQIIEATPPEKRGKTLFTAITNRLRTPNPQVVEGLFDEPDINKHHEFANNSWIAHGTTTFPTDVCAGVVLIFQKKLWNQVGGFNTMSHVFDRQFTNKVKRAGGETVVCPGLYVFHLYRWGSPDPVNDFGHLIRRN